ncbi:hypothetical protein [Pseudoalteromonas viridis]|uniref:hypothetical protein n=1 Tax=Pseudoalteromonas viridis TaxID=339617 RepID=UPI001FFE03A3|nr:hypothetical protein [Pseudoalteromonas viridis]
MSLKHILKIIVKHRNISVMILIQIAIAVTIVGNASFISYGTLKNWLIPSHLDETEILNVYTKVFRQSGRQIGPDPARFNQPQRAG